MKADVGHIFSRGIRLTPDADEFLRQNEVEGRVYEKILSCGALFVSKEMIDGFSSSLEKIPEQATVNRAPGFKPIAAELPAKFRIMGRSDITGKSNCSGKLEDFLGHFRNRFERISKILRLRISERPLVEIRKLKEHNGVKVRIIAMVTDKRTTKKGNMLLDVEDEEGVAKVVIPQSSSDVFRAAQRLLNDDIVAIDGVMRDELFIADGFTWPEIPFAREQKKSEADIAIAYLSDLHFGSKKCLEKEFSHFISWLHGSEGRQDLAGKVKYIAICGDLVDGIGVYPQQEKELTVKDIYKQYELFDAAMEKIPDYITVFVIPGNHDAVRRAEPQPSLPFDLMKSEVVRMGNPSLVEIEGLKHLMYHGTSLDSVIAGISGLTYAKPEDAMLELLKRRHLSPIYGDNTIVPEERDYLVIDEEPDVLHMGHVHKNGYMLYRGTLILNSGTFQDRTDYQARMGHMPTPGLVPILETATGKLSHLSFMGEQAAGRDEFVQRAAPASAPAPAGAKMG